MILVDTCIWIDHLRKPEAHLTALQLQFQILTHPYVIGELALGSLRSRHVFLSNLQDQPTSVLASHDEVIDLISARMLHGRGIGYVDAHLIASLRLSPGSALWTRDQRLVEAATSCGCTIHEP